jgi:hypothetical protein
VDSHPAVIIPFHDCIFFVGSLNRAQLSGRLSEVAQTLDAISGRQVLAGGRRLSERWLAGAVGVGRSSTIGQGRLGSLTQFRSRTSSTIGHITVLFSKEASAVPFAANVVPSINTT